MTDDDNGLKWLFRCCQVDGPLPTRTSRVRHEDGDLILDNIRREDHGKYECVATNVVTSVITATQLIVECNTFFLLLLLVSLFLLGYHFFILFR